MKRIAISLSILALMGTGMKAQSCDAAYPEGNWINELPGVDDERPYYVDISVHRVTEIDKEHQNRRNCGYMVVTDNKTEKTIYEGHLNYAGKGFENGLGNGKYYFKVNTSNGQEHVLELKKTGDGLQMVSLTGPMGNHAFLKESCFQAPLNGSWTPATIEPTTESELLESLKDALNDYDKDRIDYRTRGFGNVRQYINTHAKLDPTKPKYLKPKGTGSINIRNSRSTTAAKVGELKPGQTLLVLDEFDGWCQAQLDANKSGWVSLSVVTLTNTPSKQGNATNTTGTATTSFILANGKLGPLYIGQSVSSLPKSVDGLYDRYEYTKEEIENEMDGNYTLELCHFYKDGKEIFQANADDKKLSSFILKKGSSFIKTAEGFHVGYSVRTLCGKKRLQWETYYEGTAFGTDGHFTYHMNSSDVINNDFPTKLSEIKTTAKIVMIEYR